MSTSVGIEKMFILEKYLNELHHQGDLQLVQPNSDGHTNSDDHCSSPRSRITSNRTRNCVQCSCTSCCCAGSTSSRSSPFASLVDLIELQAPLCEQSILRLLQAKHQSIHSFINIGPVLLCLNKRDNLREAHRDLTLFGVNNHFKSYGNDLSNVSSASSIAKVVRNALQLQQETHLPQAIIFSGESGSGKSYHAMLALHHLLVQGGVPITSDLYRHVDASICVLRALSSTTTSCNEDSSRAGKFIEAQVENGSVLRVKIHCYLLDQCRLTQVRPNERNYHIFYQIMSGLNAEERIQLRLENYTIGHFSMLKTESNFHPTKHEIAAFAKWKTSLQVLGIPSLDVLRILAAILLLDILQLAPEDKDQLNPEAKSIGELLGVPFAALKRALCVRTRCIGDQSIITRANEHTFLQSKAALSKALYSRTLSTIVRRINCVRLCSKCSNRNNFEINRNQKRIQCTCENAPQILNGWQSNPYVGLLDMYGFQDNRTNRLEELCINLSAETLQHLYNTHVFKSNAEAAREDGLGDLFGGLVYADSVPCIDFISSLRGGLLSILDEHTRTGQCSSVFAHALHKQHSNSSSFFKPSSTVQCAKRPLLFGVRHFAGSVIYEASDFIKCNRDHLPSDIVAMFDRRTCSFGFASHMFSQELNAMAINTSGQPSSLDFRASVIIASPITSSTNTCAEPKAHSLTSDFHQQLDNLLRTLVHARPHFVCCIRTGFTAGVIKENCRCPCSSPDTFDICSTRRQIRSLQLLPTARLMQSGLPHRLSYPSFCGRYRCVLFEQRVRQLPASPLRTLNSDAWCDDTNRYINLTHHSLHSAIRKTTPIPDAQDMLHKCMSILLSIAETQSTTCSPSPPLHGQPGWAFGRRHLFFAERVRQQLERLRDLKRDLAATLIQSYWKGYKCRFHFKHLKQNIAQWPKQRNQIAVIRPLHSVRTEKPKTSCSIVCDEQIIEKTCTAFGLDYRNPPPLPPSRNYTVTGKFKTGYPQMRILKIDFLLNNGEEQLLLRKGDCVLVTGASFKRGHLVIEHHMRQFHIPFQYLYLVQGLLKGCGNQFHQRRVLATSRRQNSMEIYYNVGKLY